MGEGLRSRTDSPESRLEFHLTELRSSPFEHTFQTYYLNAFSAWNFSFDWVLKVITTISAMELEGVRSKQIERWYFVAGHGLVDDGASRERIITVMANNDACGTSSPPRVVEAAAAAKPQCAGVDSHICPAPNW